MKPKVTVTVTVTDICKYKTFMYATVQVEIFSFVFCLEAGDLRIVRVDYPNQSFVAKPYRGRCKARALKAIANHVLNMGVEFRLEHLQACEKMRLSLAAGFDESQLEEIFNAA